MDRGEDLDKTHVDDCAARMVCPRCGGSAIDSARGTNYSHAKLDSHGTCYWEHPTTSGFKCNKATRDRLSKPWT